MATFPQNKLDATRIAVFAGGESPEREVSLESGNAVVRALSERGHRVTTIDPANVDPASMDWSVYDAAFLALHGPFGEDGQIQEILDQVGIPYTGSDAAASRLAFSKSACKERFAQCDVPTPPYVLIHESDDARRIQYQAKKIGYPLVVKPDAQGSTLGVSIVESPEELPRALTNCFHYDKFGIVEPAIVGSEWTLGLLDSTALPLIQIETDHPLFDYQAKYQDESTVHRFEFSFPANVIQAIEKAGSAAARAVGTRGLARVDIMLDKFHQPWVLEVNTIPGLTDHSLVPKAAERMGVSLGELCELAIEGCLEHATTQSNNR